MTAREDSVLKLNHQRGNVIHFLIPAAVVLNSLLTLYWMVIVLCFSVAVRLLLRFKFVVPVLLFSLDWFFR